MNKSLFKPISKSHPPTIKKPTKLKSKALKKSINPQILLLKYFDPIRSYRIYGDLLIPSKLLDYKSKPFYLFKRLVKQYKYILAIHTRQNGVILEFEEYSLSDTTPLGLLQSRLDSLGDRDAKEFSSWMGKYYEGFQLPPPSEDPKGFSFGNTACLSYMDQVFDGHLSDAVVIWGNRQMKGDFRCRFMGINNKMLEYTTKEINFTSERFVDDCLELFVNRGIGDVLNTVKAIALRQKNDYPKLLKTLVGNVRVRFSAEIFPCVKEKTLFFSLVHRKEEADSFLMKMLGRLMRRKRGK